MSQMSQKSIYEKMASAPGFFAFAQAVELVQRRLASLGVSHPEEAIRFSVNPNLSFPPGDIESIVFTEKDGLPQADFVLNLMGLHGSSSPLPIYFTEFIAQNQDELCALRDFFDLFNHRIILILYAIWNKYRYYLLYKDNASDKISQYLLGFIGLGHKPHQRHKNLNLPKLLSYSGLIALKGHAYGSIENILKHYFSHPHVEVIPCIKRTVDITAEQITKLGTANSSLADAFLLGVTLPDQTGKFRIHIYNLSWVQFNSFLPDGAKFDELSNLVKFIFLSHLTFDLQLDLRIEEIPRWKLGMPSVNRLGCSTWLGDKGDGVVVLESRWREL